jgi:hypothetical protein
MLTGINGGGVGGGSKTDLGRHWRGSMTLMLHTVILGVFALVFLKIGRQMTLEPLRMCQDAHGVRPESLPAAPAAATGARPSAGAAMGPPSCCSWSPFLLSLKAQRWAVDAARLKVSHTWSRRPCTPASSIPG